MIDLKEIIEKYPRNAATRAQLASLLHDLYPTEKLSINIALDVFDSGIATRISSLKNLDSIQVHGFVKQLVDEYGLQEQYALEGIELWAKAYGLSIESHSVLPEQKPSSSSTVSHNPEAYATPGQIINGSASDYELLCLGNNFIISKFRGFGESEITIPNVIDGKRINGIGAKAFINCQELQSLIVSDGIRYIDNAAFANCINLKHVVLPDTLRRLGTIDTSSHSTGPKGVFENCGIQKIDLPGGLRTIGDSTFYGCSALSEIDMPNATEQIGESAFSRCSKISKVILPENLKKICSSAFSSCDSLKEIYFPKSLKEIDTFAFRDCKMLTDVVLNEGLQEIGYGAFENCSSLMRFVLPSTVKTIGKDIFKMSIYNYFKGERNLTVYCYAGSYGLEYARENGYQVQNAANFQL